MPSPAAAQPTEDELKVVGLDAGKTSHKEAWGEVHVSNEAGHARSHIHLTSTWHAAPEVIFSIFTFPDNSKLFRDIQRVGSRKVLVNKPGYKEIRVEQLGELRVLWIHRQYSTFLHVVEDARQAPDLYSVHFELEKSDVLAAFTGHWDLRPIKDESGAVIGCASELRQDVLPRGVPSWLSHVPVLGDLLRGVTMRAIRRVMEDVCTAVNKIKAGVAKGKTTQEVLRELCGVVQEEGHTNGAVESRALEISEDMDDSDEVEAGADQAAAADLASKLAGRLVVVELWVADEQVKVQLTPVMAKDHNE